MKRRSGKLLRNISVSVLAVIFIAVCGVPETPQTAQAYTHHIIEAKELELFNDLERRQEELDRAEQAALKLLPEGYEWPGHMRDFLRFASNGAIYKSIAETRAIELHTAYVEEQARIAWEAEQARIAWEQEQARIAWEQEQARIAWEQEQACLQAEQAAQAASGGSGDYQSYAYSLFSNYGWSSYDFDCLVALWNRESRWNPLAHNSSSGAHGIPQALPASKMASHGADYWDNGYTQIRWGLDYIAKRYGSPANAWAHSQSYGWY